MAYGLKASSCHPFKIAKQKLLNNIKDIGCEIYKPELEITFKQEVVLKKKKQNKTKTKKTSLRDWIF